MKSHKSGHGKLSFRQSLIYLSLVYLRGCRQKTQPVFRTSDLNTFDLKAFGGTIGTLPRQLAGCGRNAVRPARVRSASSRTGAGERGPFEAGRVEARCLYRHAARPDPVSFDLTGKVAVVTGGTGVLGGALARGLALAGANVGVLGRRTEKAEAVAAEIRAAGGEALALTADVLNKEQLERARAHLLQTYGRLDILVNGAGGNIPEATVIGERNFFDLSGDALRDVFDLNLHGTVLPIQVFGEVMAQARRGSIINISSMAAARPLTRVVGYGAAKAALENLTRWLAVELAQKYGPGLRVNAVAPGFFLGEQNRLLLLNENGSLTERGQKIVAHTPMERFGEPEELVGTTVWLASSASSFVTGIVVPVDGGFSAYSGV